VRFYTRREVARRTFARVSVLVGTALLVLGGVMLIHKGGPATGV